MQHDDGTIVCTPFHVRFGKLKLFRSRDKLVRVVCNGAPTDLAMRVSTVLRSAQGAHTHTHTHTHAHAHAATS